MLQENNIIANSESLTAIIVDSNDVEKEQKGKEVLLASFYTEKPLILFFYPKDSTPGCSIEVQKFNQIYKDISKLGYEVIGCSRDDQEKHCKFIKKYALNYPLLYDESGRITEAFGVWGQQSFMGKKYMGISRSTFIIYQDRILKVYPKVKVATHADDVLEDIKIIKL